MELKELGVWGRNPPADWIQEAAQRWAVLAKRAALVYIDLFRASPLPRAETEVLALVWENPDSAEPALLAGALRVSRQSMTGLLDKLERGGYLARTPHAADRRRKTIRLRKKGLAVVRGFFAFSAFSKDPCVAVVTRVIVFFPHPGDIFSRLLFGGHGNRFSQKTGFLLLVFSLSSTFYCLVGIHVVLSSRLSKP